MAAASAQETCVAATGTPRRPRGCDRTLDTQLLQRKRRLHLCCRIGCGHPIGAAVLVDRGVHHLCVELRARLGRHVLQLADEHSADALAAHVAVGIVRAEAAALRRAEHAGGGEGVRPHFEQLHVDASDDRSVARAGADR
eukprot:1308605-Prymnesium_polylepis.1